MVQGGPGTASWQDQGCTQGTPLVMPLRCTRTTMPTTLPHRTAQERPSGLKEAQRALGWAGGGKQEAGQEAGEQGEACPGKPGHTS